MIVKTIKKEDFITVKKLIEGLKKTAGDNLKEKYLNDNIRIVSYVGYSSKVALAQMVVNVSTIVPGTNELKINSPSRYLMHVYALIKNYTNISISEKNINEEYDMLKEYGLIEYIMESIPESELAEFQTISSMVYEDLLSNRMSAQSFIKECLSKVSVDIGSILGDGLTNLTTVIENLDAQQVDKILKKLAKFAKKIITNIVLPRSVSVIAYRLILIIRKEILNLWVKV